jgi:hypothetical protein
MMEIFALPTRVIHPLANVQTQLNVMMATSVQSTRVIHLLVNVQLRRYYVMMMMPAQQKLVIH